MHDPDALPLLPSREFRPRIYGVGAWTDNLHFAYDLVATLKPKLLVELGTDRSESYFAFCQAVAERATKTRCYAIDTWRGDQQAGGYDETTFREVSTHNQAHYRDFSTLLRCSFDDAVRRFSDGSIDLLHLDGLHTEDAVRHDVETWLPKLRPGGVFLMHDVAVRQRDFGVWEVWEELGTRGRSYTFAQGPGLGVWQKPPATVVSSPLESLLSADTEVPTIAGYYRTRANELQQLIADHWRDGTIRETAAAHQSIIQVFHSSDGTHREEDSVQARIGHGEWKEVSLALPVGAGAAPLRIDFVSPFTTIDIAAIRLTLENEPLFSAEDPIAFATVQVTGDAERCADPRFLRIKVIGIDPQLYLPLIELPRSAADVRLSLRLRVSCAAAVPH